MVCFREFKFTTLESMIIAHVKPPKNDSEEYSLQSNKDHSEQVANLSAKFAAEFGFAEYARVAALLHDKGKEQQGFQAYIKSVSGYDSALRHYQRTPHAYVGALIAKQLFAREYPFLSPIIIAHHRGLYDWSEFLEKMNSEIPQDVKVDNISANLSIPVSAITDVSNIHHIIRVLFSSLVDADYLDTEAFMNREKSLLRGVKTSLSELLPKLINRLSKLREDSEQTPLNKIRDDIQQLCRNAANKTTGFYSLSVPTGGGKTLSSLLWGMLHAIKNNKKRIIIAIPYTSIITQTAEILRDIFGAENVLEHHSALDNSKFPDDTESLRATLATENWDYPIIVTTNVQLFESIYSNKPSACRKLHNICNSVLILDEVQVLPIDYLQPIIDSLKKYHQLFGVSVLFITASLPAFRSDILDESFADRGAYLHGFESIEEIIPQDMKPYKLLQRAELHFDKEESSYQDIADRICKNNRALCIVNTRKDALNIFNCMPDDTNTFHLSRMMCTAHISSVIKKVKKVLKEDVTTPIKVISTQLIEAGVDIDFPVVFRQKSGLDSIIQAAGRCNREGSIKGLAPVYIFKIENRISIGFIARSVYSLENIGVTHNWFAPEVMTQYFVQFYSRTETFDKIDIANKLYNTSPSFESASKDFKLIDDNVKTVIVNYMDSESLVAKIKEGGASYNIIKQLYQYSVNLRERDFNMLANNNIIEEILPNIYFLPDKAQYKDNIGLTIDSHFLEELLIK